IYIYNQETQAVSMFVDYNKSIGNYIVDADGNTFLDIFTQISSIPIGYNHPDLIRMLDDPEVVKSVINRPCLGVFPGTDWPDRLRGSLMSIAPSGLPSLTTMACGSCSNENAFKIMYIWYRTRERGGSLDFTKEELESSLVNKPPGCPELSILSFHDETLVSCCSRFYLLLKTKLILPLFSGGFHGRTMASLATTHSKPIHKIDIPSLDWPIARFPVYKYPLDEYVRENQEEDRKCIEEVDDLMNIYAKKGKPVAGVIIEPIQAEGGDNHGSNDFFRSLQKVVKKNGAALLIDEVQTGCGPTGKMWCHEHFGLEEAPDIVTFSKKMLTGGIFCKDELSCKTLRQFKAFELCVKLFGYIKISSKAVKLYGYVSKIPLSPKTIKTLWAYAIGPRHGYRIFNTWMGDPSKVILLDQVLKVIKRDNLLQNTTKTGDILYKGITDLEKRFPKVISSTRGKDRGTFIAFDCKDVSTREQVVGKLKLKGIHIGVCGERAIRLRPALVFQPHHAAIFLDNLESVIKSL
ncbi:4-aminobutyrate aminotransferase, mitochondrial, partial [Armadillidium nasatum]